MKRSRLAITYFIVCYHVLYALFLAADFLPLNFGPSGPPLARPVEALRGRRDAPASPTLFSPQNSNHAQISGAPGAARGVVGAHRRRPSLRHHGSPNLRHRASTPPKYAPRSATASIRPGPPAPIRACSHCCCLIPCCGSPDEC